MTMTPSEKREEAESGQPALVLFKDNEGQPIRYDHVTETDYALLCLGRAGEEETDGGRPVLDEWRKHSVRGVRWL